MTAIGTSVAAGVAQTTLQAQQVARQGDNTAAQSVRDARRLHELVRAHMEALDEGQAARGPDHIEIDDQLPDDRHGQTQGEHPRRHPAAAPLEQPPTDATAAEAAATIPPNADEPLYRHVDLQA